MSGKPSGRTSGPGGPGGVIESADRPEKIRNVALVGHAGSGKTTLVEALLAVTETIARPGTISDGTTVSDTDPIEIAQQRSVSLAICPMTTDGVTVNLLDTPGSPDFVGELRAGLRAADAALFVIAAGEGVDPTTLALWEECAQLGLPRAVVISRLDGLHASYAGTLATCQDAFGATGGQAVLPLYLPEDGPAGVPPSALIGLLSRQRLDYSGGYPPRAEEASDDVADNPEFEQARAELIEAIIAESEDESLLDRYVAGEELALEILIDDLETAVARGTFHPVIPVCSPAALGLAELIEVLASAFPSPLEHDLPAITTLDGTPVESITCDAGSALVGEVVRTTVDPYAGRVSVVRLFAGTITTDTAIHVCGHGGADRGHPDHDADERVGHLYSPLGATLRPIERAVAGDIVAIPRLGTAETSDTISAKAEPLLIAPWEMPEALLPVAIRAASRNDDDALARALERLVATDPVVRVERDTATGQLVIWCLGESHSDAVLERLRASASLDTEPVRVALHSTFTAVARGHGRHVKQSGGHGQFAVCDVEITPSPRGSGITFESRVVGGSVPAQYVGSVEKGARHQLEHGVDGAAGCPVTDVHITLLDGKAHSVDSSDAAFQTAGSLAVRDAAQAGDISLLEPIASLLVDVPDPHVGAVLSDLPSRRGRVTGTEPVANCTPGNERTVVHAEVPEAELTRYAVTLRALTSGTGRFSRSFARHEVVPPSATQTVRDGAVVAH
ncbi:MAG: elongation factor G-like protein EF-G2 [Jatrophihabitans sp.]